MAQRLVRYVFAPVNVTVHILTCYQGRVLIMTTKNPEKLDSALTRPDRINFWIKFTLATHGQIRQIFYRMYDSDLDKKKSPRKTPIAPIKIQNNASNEKENAWIRQYLRTPTPFVTVNSTELAQVSRRFRRSSSRGSLLSSRQLCAPLFRP
jgi:chaperone BCS1